MQFGAGLLMAGGGLAAVNVAVAANANNLNMFVLCGSPTVAGVYTVTVNSGVLIGSTSTATPALVTGTFPAGSTVRLVVNGRVEGRGGPGAASRTSFGPGFAGGAGGDAISLGNNLEITNSGNIRGGGGGGGSGGGYDGLNSGAGGTGAGSQGAATAGALGGDQGGGEYAGNGGAGGAFGSAGASGTPMTYGQPGGAGGAPGFAIRRNGRTVTLTGNAVVGPNA